MSHDLSMMDPLEASVTHLLSRAYQLPCSTAAQAFNQLVQPTARFQLALDALLPLLDPGQGSELEKKILVCFILYSLYAPYPITINPFKTVLFVTFVKEKEKACGSSSHVNGGTLGNEQLVWVLWKILKGDGSDIGPYSPSSLARSPLPPKLKATNLTLDDDLYSSDIDDSAYLYSISSSEQEQRNGTESEPKRPSSPLPDFQGPNDPRLITPEQDTGNGEIARGMNLLLQAKDRVLKLSEQRDVIATMKPLAASNMITPLDLAPIIARNPSLSHPVITALLCHSARIPSTFDSDEGEGDVDSVFPLTSPFLDVLAYLPPTLATFDLFGYLLRDETVLPGGAHETIKGLVKEHVLSRFVHESIEYLERVEREERSDDVFEVGVANLCRFYASLLRFGIISPTEAEAVEMMHFSLRNAKFQEANVVYRMLVGAGQ